MKLLIVTTVLILILNTLIRADTKIDFLQEKLLTSKDYDRIDILNQLSIETRNSDPLESIDYGRRALQLAESLKSRIYIAHSYKNIGTTYHIMGDYALAKTNLESALKSYMKIADKRGIASTLNNLGLVNLKMNKLDKALEFFLNSLKLETEMDNQSGIAHSYNNLGNFYYQIDEMEQALEYYSKALIIYEEIDDNTGISNELNNIGVIYDEKKEYLIALEYYLKSLEIDQLLQEPSNIATLYNNIGIVYQNMDMPDKALEYLVNSLDITKEIGEKYSIANTAINIANIYLNNNNLSSALQYLKLGLEYSEASGAKDLLVSIYHLYSTYHSQKRDFELAFYYQGKYLNEKIKIVSEQNQNMLTEIKKEFELEKKQIEIDHSRTSRKITFIVTLFIAIIVAVALLSILHSRFSFKERLITEMNNVNDKLKVVARTDPLTKIANRRAMLEKIEYERYRFERYERAFVIMIGDIDNFKDVNDSFGHDAGDFVLKELSALILSLSRKQDIIGRWGGEEFMLLLPETNLTGGRKVAEKINRSIREKVFNYKGNIIHITMTLGVGIYDQHDSIEDIIAITDKALYEGKHRGKNTIVTISELS